MDSSGDFCTPGVNGLASWVPLGKQTQESEVLRAIREEMLQVRDTVDAEAELFARSNKSIQEKGRRMMFLFQRDLLPGVHGKILESKQNRDEFKPKSISAEKKLLSWLFLVVLNLGMLFYIMLFALQEARGRQAAWLRSFLIWLVLEVCLALA